MHAKVVIVGGGVMGVSIALHAARRADPLEEPVVLLERRTLAAGSSGRSGAILRQHYSDRVVAAMARDSLRVYAGLERATGRSIGFQKTGVITLAGPGRPEQIALVERNIAMQVEIGIDTRRVEADEIRRLVPGIDVADGSVGAWEPDGGGVDPVRTVEVLAALAREQGAATLLGVEATEILLHDGRACGVETTAGPVEAEQVVVAAGPWTRRLLLGAGVDLPLRVVRPEQHFLAMPPASRSGSEESGEERAEDARMMIGEGNLPAAAHAALLDLERGFYARCETHPSRDGLASPRTRVGRMDYSHDAEVDDPDRVDENVSPAFESWARERLEERLPVYREREDVGSIVGLYTLSPDAQALIGPILEVPGLYVVSGFSGHGFKLAPSIGEGVAQMLWKEPVSAFDAAFFSPDRFRGKGADVWGGAFGL